MAVQGAGGGGHTGRSLRDHVCTPTQPGRQQPAERHTGHRKTETHPERLVCSLSINDCGVSLNGSKAVCEAETRWLWICRFTATTVTERSCSALGHRVLGLLHAQLNRTTQS
ncbi:hypothetical protein PAMP_023847 [Pampus punctatissimus]